MQWFDSTGKSVRYDLYWQAGPENTHKASTDWNNLSQNALFT
jgi:hypothetical protein